MRQFETGATRDSEEGKLDYEGFLNPLVLQRYAEYMHGHRIQADGGMRDSDNWQKGIPKTAYMKSLWRHFMDLWLHHRGYPIKALTQDALCAIIFNAMGYLLCLLREEEGAAEKAVDQVQSVPQRFVAPLSEQGCLAGDDGVVLPQPEEASSPSPASPFEQLVKILGLRRS